MLNEALHPESSAERPVPPARRILRRVAFIGLGIVLLALVLLAYRQPELWLNWAGSVLC